MNDRDDSPGGSTAGMATPLPVFMGRGRVPGALAPFGLAIAFADGTFTIRVCAEGGLAPIVLGPYADEDVIAIWRRMAADSGLPLLLPGPDGALQPPYPQIGRLFIGPRRDRRRLAVLSGRRPRFLAKRRAATLPRRPRVHRETELAAGRADGR